MRKNFGVKTYLYPQPVLIVGTYNDDGTADAMNAAWGGIADENMIFMCLSAEHKTVKNILKRKAFTVSPATEKYVVECDYFGIESGNRTRDKVAKAGMHIVKSEFVDAPVIEELPLCLECRLVSYDENTCRLFGEIVNVSACECILTDGKIDPAKLNAIAFDPVNNAYLKVGEKVGNAFKDGLKIR